MDRPRARFRLPGEPDDSIDLAVIDFWLGAYAERIASVSGHRSTDNPDTLEMRARRRFWLRRRDSIFGLSW